MSRVHSVRVFFVLLVVNLLIHFPFINKSPVGTHVWRQCNTLAMSRNFCEEGMNILEPRIDRRNETDGITGSHFPLYEWGLALISKGIGFSETLARVYSLVISSLGLFAFYLLLSLLGAGRFYAFSGAFLLLSVPQIYYDSINAMPDNLALTAALFGQYFLLRFYRESRLTFGNAAIIFILIAGLIKFQFLIIPISSIAFIRLNKNHIYFSLLSAVLIILPVVSWYRYALQLTDLNNLREFGLWIKPIELKDKLSTFSGNLISDLPELLCGWPLLLMLIFLMLRNLRGIKFGRKTWMCLIWFLTFSVFYTVAIERMRHHSYYFMALIPLFVFIVSFKIQSLKRPQLWMIVLCLFNLTWAFFRIIPSRWLAGKEGVPSELINQTQRMNLSNSVPKGTLTLVGPDISGCIYFYYTKTKGYSFEDPEELLKTTNGTLNIDRLISQGVTHLICYRDFKMAKVLNQIPNKKLVQQSGKMEVWLIQSSN